MRTTVTCLLMLFTGQVFAAHAQPPGSLESCLTHVTEIRAGDFIKVEYLGFADEGGAAWEIELRDIDGRYWEFECDAGNGDIIEIEQEVDSPEHPLFQYRVKVSEDEAREIALRLYPGTVREVEYEIESNGLASYEFDILDSYGVEFKVEVDATTGEIVEFQLEKWEIGGECGK